MTQQQKRNVYKRFSSLFILPVFALVAACGGGGGDGGSSSGSNPSGSTSYEIHTVADLQKVNAEPNKNFTLMEDLEISGTWTPLGGKKGFTGKFDGTGHTITFADPTITALVVDDKGNVAGTVGLFGLNKGTIENLTVAGTMTHTASVNVLFSMGGIAGVSYGTIKNSKATADLTLTQTFEQLAVLGGITGYVSGGDLVQVAATGNVILSHSANKNGFAGGIAGTLESNQSGITVSKCYTTGKITNDVWPGFRGTGGIAGGLFGDVTIEDCFTTTDLKGASGVSQTGTIVGRAQGKPAKVTRVASFNSQINSGGTPFGTGLDSGIMNFSVNYYDNAFGGLKYKLGTPVDRNLTVTQQWWETDSNLKFDFTSVWKWDANLLHPVFVWEK